jgi:hypothetical protein
VDGTKYCGVPTTTARAKQQRTVMEHRMRNPKRVRAQRILLSGTLNFGIVSESYKNPQNFCIWTGGLSLPGWKIRPTRTVKSKIFFSADVHFTRGAQCKIYRLNGSIHYGRWLCHNPRSIQKYCANVLVLPTLI